jgi:hypothetical protein
MAKLDKSPLLLRRIALPLVCGITLLAGTAWVAGQPPLTAPGGPDIPVPQGFVLIDESLWMRLSGDSGEHMRLSREHYLRKEFHAAADEMRKASAYVQAEAGQAAGATKRALQRSGLELDELAHRMEHGTVHSIHEIEHAFARAHHALADHYHQRAEQAYERHEPTRAGRFLQASADNLDRGAHWAGAEIREGAHVIVRDTRVLGGKLVEGTGFVAEEVGRGIKGLGRGVERLGHAIDPIPPKPIPAREPVVVPEQRN